MTNSNDVVGGDLVRSEGEARASVGRERSGLAVRRSCTVLAWALLVTACGSPMQSDGGTDAVAVDGDSATGDGGGGTCGARIGVCNPVTSMGCAMGQACSIGVDMGGMLTTTCAMPGMGGYGAACSTPTSCMPGFACLNGMCAKLCCRAGDDTPCRTGPGGVAGAVCNLTITGSDLMACVAPTRCDWFAQDCPGGANCQPLSSGGTSCVASGTGTEGMPCGTGTMTNCARGHACIAAGMSGACRRICNPEARGDAGMGGGGGGGGGGVDAGADVTPTDAAMDGGGGDAGSDASAMDGTSADVGTDASAGDAPSGDGPTMTDGPPATDGGPIPMTCPMGFTCNGVTGAPSNYGVCVPM